MFCATCAAPLTPGISYCNRCGAGVKERSESKSYSPIPFLIAITIIAVSGMGMMLGGSMAMKMEADMPMDFIGFFLLSTFIMVLVTEVLLVRQLSKLSGKDGPKLSKRDQRAVSAAQQFVPPVQMPYGQGRALGEPVGSVTENTTRTLEYAQTHPDDFQSR